MQVSIERVSRSSTNEVYEGDQMLEVGVKVSVEPPWLENF